MTDKEHIIIDGEKYNKCNGCKLWDGYICTGDRSYEPNAEAHRAICNEHMAKEFWKVYHELIYKTQEYEKLKSQVDEDYNYYTTELKTLRDIISNKEKRNAALYLMSGRYRKALEEIEGLVKNFCKDCDDYEDCNWDKEGCYYSLIPNLKDIINKAKRADLNE